MKFNIITIILLCLTMSLAAQTVDVNKMTKEEVLELTYDQLLDLPFEDLLKLADIIGVSTDELLQMAMNRQLSTASKKTESLFDSPLSTTVISKEDIAMSGATSLPELFRTVPGMIVREKSNGNYDVHIRGIDNVPPDNVSHFSQNTLTLVMIDNIPFYNYINGGTFWETLPISLVEIERIDIIRGPSSSLYGPNAVSGVINIITKKHEANDKLQAQADVRYGNYNSLIANTSLGSKIGKGLSFRIGGGYEQRNRTQEDYFCYAAGKYMPKENVYSIFNAGKTNFDPVTGKNLTPFFDKTFQYDDYLLAQKKYNVDANLYYTNKDLKVNLTSAYQNSDAQTVFMETYVIPFAVRTSKIFNNTLAIKWKGLAVNVSNNKGEQNMSQHIYWPSTKFDINNLYANIDYSYTFLDKFTLTPGFNFQQATVSTEKYKSEVDNKQKELPTFNIASLINKKKQLDTYGGSLRLDYNPIDNLRLIAAMRMDKYNYPKKAYFSYQFVSSYKINDKHLIRALYSRANRGSFMANTYIDYNNKLMFASSVDPNAKGQMGILGKSYQALIAMGKLDPNERMYNQHYLGNKDLKLLTMDMVELGYRGKLSDNLQVDFEVFYSITKNFDDLISITPKDKLISVENIFPNPDPTDTINPFIPLIRLKEKVQYKNIDLKAHQMGLSYSINYMPFNKMYFNLYGTIQNTELKNHKINDTTLTNLKHTWTPAFYGGLSINYMPIEKLNVNANINYMAKQEYNRYISPYGKPDAWGETSNPNEVGQDKFDARVMLNLTISYKFWEENSVYLSARNLTNAKREFGFADPIKPMFFGGVRFKF